MQRSTSKSLYFTQLRVLHCTVGVQVLWHAGDVRDVWVFTPTRPFVEIRLAEHFKDDLMADFPNMLLKNLCMSRLKIWRRLYL